MKERRKSEFFNRVITCYNAKEIGESIAVSAIKKIMPYSGKSLDDYMQDWFTTFMTTNLSASRSRTVTI